MTFPIHLVLIVIAIFAAIAGVVATLLFGLALRYGPFINGADPKSPRIRRLRETIVFVVVAMGIVLGPLATFPILLAAAIVIGTKYTKSFYARCRCRRTRRDPENNSTEPTAALRVAFAPNA